MKRFKILALILAVATLFGLASCKKDAKKTYTVSAPDGAPVMAIAELMKNDDKYSCDIISASDVSATLTKGEKDFVIAPTNAGMTISMRTGNYKICAVTSWGNLYIVAKNGTIFDNSNMTCSEFLSQFSGKNVYSIGVNAVPDKTFKHLLNKAGVSDCTINSAEAPEILAGLKSGTIDYAILGEPAVTSASINVSGLKILCSISDLWEKSENKRFPQASVFAKSGLKDGVINEFLDRVSRSINYLNASEDNALELGGFLEQTGKSTLKGAIVQKAYKRMNQNFVTAISCKDEIIEFVKVLGVNYTEENSSVFYEKN